MRPLDVSWIALECEVHLKCRGDNAVLKRIHYSVRFREVRSKASGYLCLLMASYLPMHDHLKFCIDLSRVSEDLLSRLVRSVSGAAFRLAGRDALYRMAPVWRCVAATSMKQRANHRFGSEC